MNDQKNEIYSELLRFAEIKLKVPADVLAGDPSFEDMNVDSLTKLEILLHGDDTFGSHVLDYLEDGHQYDRWCCECNARSDDRGP